MNGHKPLLLGGAVLLAALGTASYFLFFNGKAQTPLVDPNKPSITKDDPTAKKNDGLPVVKPAVYDAPAQSLAAATDFVHSGPQPVQTGLAADALDAKRAAALRGLVFKEEKSPIPGVQIAIQHQPKYGSSLSRNDGSYDMVVNGGGLLTVGYTHESYLPVWRQTAAPWQDYVWLPPVKLTPRDANANTVKLEEKTPQVARGSEVKDKDGARRTTLVFPSGVKATDGAGKPLDALTVRATEYTVGAKGPAAMPAPLPPNSAYT